MNAPHPHSEEEVLKTKIYLLFSEYNEAEPGEELRTISEYFDFLAKNISYHPPKVKLSGELLGRFEAVCLLLRDRLRLYPETIAQQVGEILNQEHLERTFAVIATLSERDLNRLVNPSFFDFFSFYLAGLKITEGFGEKDLSRNSLLKAVISLKRLSQIAQYASSMKLVDYDIESEQLKDHYDPSLVDKAKLNAFINIFKVQIKTIPDGSIQERLLSRIENLEEEIRKPRPRWGKIIAGFFIIFSFIADLKAISPSTYEATYKTAEAIVLTLHRDGSVEGNRRKPFLPQDLEDKGKELIITTPPSIHEGEEDSTDGFHERK